MAEPNDNQPIATKQFDRVQAAMWKLDDGANDATKPFYTVTLSRSYLDTNNNWQRSHSFTARDLPHVKLAADWAMRELLLKDE
jgi:hypothetical protein